MRQALLTFLVLLCRSNVESAEISVGSKVVVIQSVELKTNGGSKLILSPGSVLDVRQVADETLTVGAPRVGDVPKTVVISLNEAEPLFSNRLEKDPRDATSWTARGKIWFHHLQQEKAIADFDESLKLRPDGETMTLRAFAWKRLGNKMKAMSLLDDTIQFDPHNALAWRVRGATWASLGDFPKTLAHYTESIRIDPENPESLLHRAILLSGCTDDAIRNGQQALQDATKANQLTGGDVPLFLNCLSFAHSEAGDFEAAIKCQQKVVELSPNGQNKAAEARIEQFQKKQPFRTSWK